MTLGSMPTLNSVGFFAMRRSRQMVKQASRNTGVACEAELRARILTRSEGDVLKGNGRRCTFCRQDQQRPLGSRMAEAADCLQDLRSDSVARLAGHTRAEERPSDAADAGRARASQGSKHRASVLGKVWKPAGQSQSIVAARRSQSSQDRSSEQSLDAGLSTPPRQTGLIHAGFRLCGLCA
jgi:hypothetical protein